MTWLPTISSVSASTASSVTAVRGPASIPPRTVRDSTAVTEIRTLTDDDLDAALALARQGFDIPLSRAERSRVLMRPERMLGAFDGGRLVSVATVRPAGQTFGGRTVPMGAVAAVVTAPQHRGTGVGTAVLRVALGRMREEGLPISTLYPATSVPYRRLGWEVAGARVEREVPLRSLAELPPPTATEVVPSDGDTSPLREVHRRWSAGEAGMLVRDGAWWERKASWWDDHDRGYTYLACREGRPTGYVVYHHGAAEGSDEWFRLVVDELVAEDRDGALALWRLLATSRSVAVRATYWGGLDDPLLHLLPEQDTRVREDWRWMTRVVDAPAAVASRGFPPGLDVTVGIDLGDPACPWNAGRWVLSAGDGRGRLERGGDGAVSLTANGLAALFTGHSDAWTLRRLGLASGPDGALSRLAAAFAGPAPWMVDFF